MAGPASAATAQVTSCPAARNAVATGSNVPTWPAPAVLLTRTFS